MNTPRVRQERLHDVKLFVLQEKMLVSEIKTHFSALERAYGAENEDGPEGGEIFHLRLCGLEEEKLLVLQMLYAQLRKSSLAFAEMLLGRDKLRLTENKALEKLDYRRIMANVEAVRDICNVLKDLSMQTVLQVNELPRLHDVDEAKVFLRRRIQYLIKANIQCLVANLTSLAIASGAKIALGTCPEALAKSLLTAAYKKECDMGKLEKELDMMKQAFQQASSTKEPEPKKSRTDDENAEGQAQGERTSEESDERKLHMAQMDLKWEKNRFRILSEAAAEAESIFSPANNLLDRAKNLTLELYEDKEVQFGDRYLNMWETDSSVVASSSALQLAESLTCKLARPEEKESGQMTAGCVASIVAFVIQSCVRHVGIEKWRVTGDEVKAAIQEKLRPLE